MRPTAKKAPYPAAKAAFVSSLPVMAGYLALGLGFGVMFRSAGYSVLWAVLMSIFIYSGTMQYLATDLLLTNASLLTAALTTLMVNARHLFYGISVIDLYRPMGRRKPYMLFALTDETYSLICGMPSPPHVDRNSYFFYITLFDHLYWIVGCLLGALLASVLTFNVTGIDYALTALIISIAVDQWTSTKRHLPALTGIVLTVICLLIFGRERFLIPSMALISVALLLQNHFLPPKEESSPVAAETPPEDLPSAASSARDESSAQTDPSGQTDTAEASDPTALTGGKEENPHA